VLVESLNRQVEVGNYLKWYYCWRKTWIFIRYCDFVAIVVVGKLQVWW